MYIYKYMYIYICVYIYICIHTHINETVSRNTSPIIGPD